MHATLCRMHVAICFAQNLPVWFARAHVELPAFRQPLQPSSHSGNDNAANDRTKTVTARQQLALGCPKLPVHMVFLRVGAGWPWGLSSVCMAYGRDSDELPADLLQIVSLEVSPQPVELAIRARLRALRVVHGGKPDGAQIVRDLR